MAKAAGKQGKGEKRKDKARNEKSCWREPIQLTDRGDNWPVPYDQESFPVTVGPAMHVNGKPDFFAGVYSFREAADSPESLPVTIHKASGRDIKSPGKPVPGIECILR